MNLPFQDYWFEVAQFVEKRAPHDPTPMLSLNSRGPLWTWACTRPRCGEVVSTLSGAETPICYGGLEWSFNTNE